MLKKYISFALLLGLSSLWSCSETIDTAMERRSENEKAFLAYADSTGYERISLPGQFADRYVYMKWDTKVADRSTQPKATDYIRMHYTGSFVQTGQVFDSNKSMTSLATLPNMAVNGLVQGMSIALQSMAVGDKAQVVIPWYLAYGADGVPRRGMPGYASLRFEVELKSVSENEHD